MSYEVIINKNTGNYEALSQLHTIFVFIKFDAGDMKKKRDGLRADISLGTIKDCFNNYYKNSGIPDGSTTYSITKMFLKDIHAVIKTIQKRGIPWFQKENFDLALFYYNVEKARCKRLRKNR